MPLEPSRRQFLRVATAAAATAAVAAAGGTAVASESRDGVERSAISNTSGQRLADRPRPGSARVLWSGPDASDAVALTFDDGPDVALTPRVLDILHAAGAHATFFVVGRHASAHPELVRATVEAGHEIASHTLSHHDLPRLDEAGTLRELVDGAKRIEDISGQPVRLFRPPWGNLTGAALRISAELGHDVLLWSRSAAHLPPRIPPGEVLLYHDGVCGGGSLLGISSESLRDRHERELVALPEVLRAIEDDGLRLVTGSTLFR